MRLWRVELQGGEEGLHLNATVLAPDASEAGAVAAADPDHFFDLPLHAGRAEELIPSGEILTHYLPDCDEEVDYANSPDDPILWKVPWTDGLFHKDKETSLVAAPDAVSALRLVIADDPFEGQPPYGVPAAYGPVSRFVPAHPLLLWRDFAEGDLLT